MDCVVCMIYERNGEKVTKRYVSSGRSELKRTAS